MIPDQNTTGFSVTRLNGFNCFCSSPSPPKADIERRTENSGHDQVHDLRRLDPERAFAEEESERIGQLVIAHLQDALIDREDRDLRWPVGLVADAQRLARFRDRGRLRARPSSRRFSMFAVNGTTP